MATRSARLKALLAAASLIVVAMIALGVARADSQVDGRRASDAFQINPAARETTSSTNGRLSGAFAVLRSPRTENDVMPLEAVEFVRRTGIAGMNPGLSHRAVTDGDYAVFVVPANGAVCLHAVSGEAPASAGGTCGEAAEAANGSVVMAGTAGSGVRITGLVPDGIDHVTITLANSDRVTADVVENVYTAVVGGSVEAVTFSLAGTETTVPTPFSVPSR